MIRDLPLFLIPYLKIKVIHQKRLFMVPNFHPVYPPTPVFKVMPSACAPPSMSFVPSRSATDGLPPCR
jgi:hypothetical protein